MIYFSFLLFFFLLVFLIVHGLVFLTGTEVPCEYYFDSSECISLTGRCEYDFTTDFCKAIGTDTPCDVSTLKNDLLTLCIDGALRNFL